MCANPKECDIGFLKHTKAVDLVRGMGLVVLSCDILQKDRGLLLRLQISLQTFSTIRKGELQK
ncbi:MAG: hypothetical protein H6Q71_2853 [Firmicutes bacterium]|nr:hypothetical protein [Bacillota bacterium]